MLGFLPASISKLRNLKQLDASENQIVALEPSICDLHECERLELKDNPLQRPPLSVARQGIDAIRRYFSELKRSGSTTSRTSPSASARWVPSSRSRSPYVQPDPTESRITVGCSGPPPPWLESTM